MAKTFEKLSEAFNRQREAKGWKTPQEAFEVLSKQTGADIRISGRWFKWHEANFPAVASNGQAPAEEPTESTLPTPPMRTGLYDIPDIDPADIKLLPLKLRRQVENLITVTTNMNQEAYSMTRLTAIQQLAIDLLSDKVKKSERLQDAVFGVIKKKMDETSDGSPITELLMSLLS